MTDTPDTPAPAKPKQTKGDLPKKLLADIKLAEDIAAAAADPIHASSLTAEELALGAAAALLTQAGAARTLAAKASLAKKTSQTATASATTAHETLLTALRDIQARAKRKFPKDRIRLSAYAIGRKNFGKGATVFEQDAENLLRLAAQDALPGLKPDKLTAATAALPAWKTADAAQTKAIEDQADLLLKLNAKVADLNDARRAIQAVAETAWPYAIKGNAPIRRTFKLPAPKA